MKKLFVLMTVICLFAAVDASASTSYYAYTNWIGYSGTVTYTPPGETDPVTVDTSTPRVGYIYYLDYVTTDYNLFMSDWPDHSASNVHDSFFQIYDINADTVTSFSGGWINGGSDFFLSVSGVNAVYTDEDATNDSSRCWMPDQNVSARGTWTEYTYYILATGMTSAVEDGWLANTSDPVSITGYFSGTFVSEARTYSWGDTYENTYQVYLDLSSASFDAAGFTGEPESGFGSSVPVPGAVWLLGSGLFGLLGLRRKLQS